MIAMKNFHSRFDGKIAIKVCPEISNWDPVEKFKSRFD